MTLSAFPALLKEAWSRARRDHTPFVAAGLSFFALFSLVPGVLLTATVLGSLWGRGEAARDLSTTLAAFAGGEAARFASGLLAGALRPGAAGWVTLAVLLFGASILFVQLRNALNLMWGLHRPRGVGGVLTGRLAAFGMVLLSGVLMTASFTLHASLGAAQNFWGRLLPALGAGALWRLLNGTVTVSVMALLFASVYKALPSVRLEWRDVATGGLVTALLWTFVNFFLGFYFRYARPTVFYGAGTALLVTFLWVYLSAQAFLFGAEFTWVYANRFGSRTGKEDVDA